MTDTERTPQQQLEDAIQAQRPGAMVTNWLLIADGVDSEGDPMWFMRVTDGQRMLTSIGLVEFVRKLVDFDVAKYLMGGTEEASEDEN